VYPWLWEASQGWDEALSAMREAAAEYTVAGWPLAVPLALRVPLAGLRLPVARFQETVLGGSISCLVALMVLSGLRPSNKPDLT
jgi:hypothetical protein